MYVGIVGSPEVQAVVVEAGSDLTCAGPKLGGGRSVVAASLAASSALFRTPTAL